jgi:hypothetical protein
MPNVWRGDAGAGSPTVALFPGDGSPAAVTSGVAAGVAADGTDAAVTGVTGVTGVDPTDGVAVTGPDCAVPIEPVDVLPPPTWATPVESVAEFVPPLPPTFTGVPAVVPPAPAADPPVSAPD